MNSFVYSSPKTLLWATDSLNVKQLHQVPKPHMATFQSLAPLFLLCLTLVASLLPRQLRKDRFFWHFLLLAYSEALILWEEISTQNLSVSDLVARNPCVLSPWPYFKAHFQDWELRTRHIGKDEEGAKGWFTLLLVSFMLLCKATSLYLKEKVSSSCFRRNLCIKDC